MKFEQTRMRLSLTGLPALAPDQPATTIVLEYDGEPRQDQYMVRRENTRASV